MGKLARNKGYRGEHQLVVILKEAGLDATRVPLSGAADGFKDDIHLEGEHGEVKLRGDGFKNLYKWLEGVRFLFTKADRKGYLVTMRLEDFIPIIQEIKKGRGLKKVLDKIT